MTITDAMIIKFLVETLKELTKRSEFAKDTFGDRFENKEFFFLKEEVKDFQDIVFEVIESTETEKVRIVFLEKV